MRLATDLEDLQLFEPLLRYYLKEQEAIGSPVQFTRRTLDRYRDLARDYVTGGASGVLVLAEEDGDVVGFTLAGEAPLPAVDLSHPKTAVVWIAWMKPEHRKQGTALSMLRYGEPFLIEQGFEMAAMTVREGNAQGMALSRSFGAEPVETALHAALKGGAHGVGQHTVE
jgi:GNAT superfamily N-acetyltransferase